LLAQRGSAFYLRKKNFLKKKKCENRRKRVGKNFRKLKIQIRSLNIAFWWSLA